MNRDYGPCALQRPKKDFNAALIQMRDDICHRTTSDKTEVRRAWSGPCCLRFNLTADLMQVDLLCPNRSAFRPPAKSTTSIPSTFL